MSGSVNLSMLATAEEAVVAAWETRELASDELAAAVAEADKGWRAAEAAAAKGAREANGAVGRLRAWTELGRAYGHLLSAAFREAEAEARGAAEGFARAGEDGVTGRAWAGVVQATAWYYLAQYAEAGPLAEAALVEFERLGDRRGQAAALTALGNVARVSGNPARALVLTRRSLELAQACGHGPSEAVAWNNLGTVAHSLGDFGQAVASFERALELGRRIGHARIEMFALNNIGAACEGAGDLEAALAWHRESLALKEARGDRRGRAISLNNIGIILKKLGQAEEARVQQERSVALFREIDDRWGQAYCHKEFGDLARARGERAEARREYERTLELRRTMGDRLLEAEAIYTLANFLLDEGAEAADATGVSAAAVDWTEVRALAEAALAIGVETGATSIQLNAHQVLYQIEKTAGELAAALAHGEQALALERRSNSLEAEQRLKNLRVLHEVEAAARELEAERERSRELGAALERAEMHRMKAVEADEYKSEVLRIVAHDLRSPVAAIRGLGDLLAVQHAEDAETQELCGMIATSADSLLNMVSNILDASALEEGRMQARLEPLALRPWLGELVRGHEPQAHAKRQHLELEVEGELVVKADARLLATALSNLLTNAIKYSPSGRRVWVSAAGRAGEVVLAVRDEGPGLTAEDQARMFGRFTRLSAQPTAGEASTGLGLFIVRKLVDMHGGRVWAECAGPGKGATFLVALPPG